MRSLIRIVTFLIAILLITFSCKESEVRTVVVSDNNILSADDIIADTIIYSVDIVNYDSMDTWTEYRLRHMQTEKFVENIFKKVYSEQLSAYEYFADSLLTIKEVKEIENAHDYKRDHIEEIQFEETWFYSAKENIFHKEIHSIVIAYALYNEEGVRRGLKPVFRLRVNN
ncbi:hypothetical protein QA597_11240 [Marinilabiliaceae bacterium ANBcel2]|nr:hypothetical protein [Marinilabiliaceae bacterium ANBcel2]